MSSPAPEQSRTVRALFYIQASDTGPVAAPRPLRTEERTMEITINYYRQAVSVSVEVYEYLTQADHKAENLAHEQRRHWDGREFDEYIIATEGRLPYCATPEELVCQRETLNEILAVLALCTDTQRERFLLYALHDFSYAEIAEMCGCTKVAVHYSIEAVRKKFLKFFRNLLND